MVFNLKKICKASINLFMMPILQLLMPLIYSDISKKKASQLEKQMIA